MQRFSVFAHLSTPKADDYRRVLAVFSEARSGFVIHLRPTEVAARLEVTEESIDAALDQLHEWGNLDRSHDHVEAATVEEFYRVKWLYQLSARGEAAERALQIFEESLQQPGELQTQGLREIVDYLKSIRKALVDRDDDPAASRATTATTAAADDGKLYRLFRDLFGRFEEFTVQAQRFMQFLQSTIELHELSEEDFVAYKDRLIDYLQRFVDELITSAAEIGGLVEALERSEVRGHFPSIARQARTDSLDADNAEALAREHQQIEGRWDGLRRWFLGDGSGGRSQAETLRARAREAIPSLLVALQSFHDRRESGSDRRRDWAELARWFAGAADDGAAHRLWRVAFALGPARHLRINEETLALREQSDDGVRSSWLEAAPMWLAPQLRKSGRAPRASRPSELIDLSRERDHLRRLAEEENRQLSRAREHLVTNGEINLSSFSVLDASAFDLLMDMLGRAVTSTVGKAADDFPVVARSTDGSLEIELWPPRQPDAEAQIECETGTIRGPDFRVAIRSTGAPAATTPAADAAA